MAKKRKRYFLMLPTILLIGCSDYYHLAGDTVKYAVFGAPDAELSSQKIAELPYASAYLRVGKSAQAFVVLAYAEDNQLKWVTADHNVIATQNGRLTKTVGFGEDLTRLDDLNLDPLHQGNLLKLDHIDWSGKMFWSTTFRSGLVFNASIKRIGTEEINISDKKYKLMRYDENMYFPHLDEYYTNIFWLDMKNGRVVKSQQLMGPGLAAVEFTELKSYSLDPQKY